MEKWSCKTALKDKISQNNTLVIMGFKASIIGGAGGMGQWFAKYLSFLGYEVGISDFFSDRAKEVANNFGYKFFKSNIDAVMEADLVLIAVPTANMKLVIDEISYYLNDNAILCEISTFKKQHFNQLKRLNVMNLTVLSLHPMFGPTAKQVEDLTFALIPVKKSDEEMRLAHNLFPGANIIEIDVDTHDRVMSHVLSLTYLINLAFSMTVSEKDVILLKKVAGTSFTIQTGLADSITLENSDLVETVLYSNLYANETINKFLQNIDILKDPNKFKDVHLKLKNRLSEYINKEKVDDWRYESYLGYRKIM